MIVVDASILVAALQNEAGTDTARKLLIDHAGDMAAPDILAIEVCGALVRRLNAREDSAINVTAKLTQLEAWLVPTIIELVRVSAEESLRSTQLAMQLGHPIRDCAYLDLAISRDCPLVTFDRTFAERAGRIWPDVRTPL